MLLTHCWEELDGYFFFSFCSMSYAVIYISDMKILYIF